MLCLKLLAALSLLTGNNAVNQEFTSSAEIDITACPITYYGLKYEKVYVGFDSNRSTLCFNGQYRSGVDNDCILMSRGSADRGALTVLTREIPTGSGIHKLLPNLKHAGKCVNVIPLKDGQDSDIKQIELGNFGAQAIVAIKTHSGFSDDNFETDTVVNGQSVARQVFHTNKTKQGVVTDVSGCRLSGAAYKANSTIWDANICSTVTCDVFGVATAVSNCGPMERCQGNSKCSMDATCTVTGSTVINVIGQLHTVPDRCGYTLMKHASIPDLEVLGVFQERRRKDVSFLDRIILHLKSSNVYISLGPGGRVQLDNKALALNTTAKVIHGVELSKDQTGVTAAISASGYTASVHFNGYTAQIRITGLKESPVLGLCGNSSTTLAQKKASDFSVSSCETPHNEEAEVSINCNATTQWCHILKQEPFSACNMVVDAEPFITACTQTLCKYPAVDGSDCQFLEAYSRACSLHNITVEGWMSQRRCSDMQASCQNMFCSDHEFCGEMRNGWASGCLCRAIFATKYRITNSFGEATVCKHQSATMTMANCLLEEKGIDYTVLHMNDESCVGQMDNETHMVTFSFNSTNTCGTVVKSNNSEIIFHNTIKTGNSTNFGIITRHDDVHLDFSCQYIQPDVKSLSIKIKDSSVIQQLVSGEWRYNLSMNAYTDDAYTQAINPDKEINLNERVYIELKVVGLDENTLSLVIDSCWATPEPSPNGNLNYNIILHGCPNPVDPTIGVVSNGLGLSSYFFLSVFQFNGRTSDVYMHCKAVLCVKQNQSCAPECSQVRRKRRATMSKYEERNLALITMAWSN